MPTTQLLAGLALSAGIGWLAYRRNSLTRSGVAGAVITGTLIFGFGGWTWGLVLIAFFVSSTLLSHWRWADKAELADKFAKGERRDLGQTLANGGYGAALAIAVFLLVDLPGEARLGNPTYAFLTLAASSASVWLGAATMAVFGCETAPIMMLTGYGGSVLGIAWRKRLMQIAAWCVVVAGIVSVGRGMGYVSWNDQPPAGCPFCQQRAAENGE